MVEYLNSIVSNQSIIRAQAYLEESSTLARLDKLARCNFTTFVVIVADNK